ncbi:DUF2949 domain-containing protein [Candidatus Cyanaurora vandensis]|uniref:DUF2949 domain-containing protein n=1 Tax=Candidatus Cyanaurora vandensis TaxID=2714958 RepID=UPI00257EB701|nr:DUF2949 domain-containing protein [Candidatus Cyanaurora vandensis]
MNPFLPETTMTCATLFPVLKDLLTDSEYQIVKKAAQRSQDTAQLPVVAWAMGFVSLEQLDTLLNPCPPT